MRHNFMNCLSRQFMRVVCKMYCHVLVNKSRAGQGTLVLISRIIIHGTKAAALVTKSYSNQDKESKSLLLTGGQISCNVQSHPLLTPTLKLIHIRLLLGNIYNRRSFFTRQSPFKRLSILYKF